MHDTKSQINNVCIIQQKENTESNNDDYNDNIELLRFWSEKSIDVRHINDNINTFVQIT